MIILGKIARHDHVPRKRSLFLLLSPLASGRTCITMTVQRCSCENQCGHSLFLSSLRHRRRNTALRIRYADFCRHLFLPFPPSNAGVHTARLGIHSVRRENDGVPSAQRANRAGQGSEANARANLSATHTYTARTLNGNSGFLTTRPVNSKKM